MSVIDSACWTIVGIGIMCVTLPISNSLYGFFDEYPFVAVLIHYAISMSVALLCIKVMHII